MEFGNISSILVMGLTIGCIYAVIAVGLNLLYGAMRMLNIAHGSLIMLGAYTAYWLFTIYNISPLFSAILAALGGGIMGLVVYRLIFASSIRTAKSLESLEGASLLIFFGLLILTENVASLSWGTDFRGYTYLAKAVTIWGTPVALNRVSAALIAIVLCLAVFIFLQRTLFGKAVRAVIQDKDATQLAGVNTDKIYIFCFVVGFAMAGLAGALISMFYSINPFMGLPYTMMAFVVIILGGLGNILGSLVGGLMLGLVITAVVAYTTPGFSFIVQYVIFILVILFMPHGIFGRRVR
jgi:branched-chain amino acid transport system permease protein